MDSSLNNPARSWDAIISPSPLQARRLLRMIYWLITLLMLYAWAPTLKSLLSTAIWPTVSFQQEDAGQFMALVYDEQSFPHGSDFAPRLKDHILSLQSAGYTPIRLADAKALIKEHLPVTQKAVLLTFDFNDLSVYPEVESVLRDTGWYATAFYCTEPNEKQRADLRILSSMKRSPYWEIGARSHLGYERIPDPTINKFVRYLSAYHWLPEQKQHETPEDFRVRVHADHQASLKLFNKRLSIRPIAYAYPFGDFGQLDNGTEEIRQINQVEAARHYPIAFTRGELALNNQGADPVRLNRLHIKPEWNGRTLAKRLDQDIRSAGVTDSEGQGKGTGAWVLEKGYISLENTTTHLRTDNLGRDAAAWYATPSLKPEYNAVIDFSWDRGDFLVYFQRTQSPSTFSRMRFSTNNVATIEQKRALQPPTVIQDGLATIRPDHPNTLKLFLRGNRVYARLNGNSIFSHGVEISQVKAAPKFGVGLAPDNGEVSTARIHHVAVRDALSRIATWDADIVPEGQAIDWLHENAGRLTHVSPPVTLDLDSVSFGGPEFQSVRMLANVYSMQFIPRAQLDSIEALDRLPPLTLAELMTSRSMDGLLLDLTLLESLSINRLQTWLQQCDRQLKHIEVGLFLRLPPHLEALATLQNDIKRSEQIHLVSTRLAEDEEAPGKVIRFEEIAQAGTAQRKLDLNQIQLLEEPQSMSIDEVQHRVRLLQIQGEKALTSREYEKAIVALSEWHELSPDDSRPVTLIAESLYSLGYKEESLDFYRQSLDINPGQVKLVARLTEIFSFMQHDEEARNLLNLYVRLVPHDPDILYAQALWLIEQDRPNEANARLDSILKIRPLDFQSLLLKLRISTDPTDRLTTLQRLKTLVGEKSRHLDLVDAIQKYDLLTLQDSHIIVDMLHDIERSNPDPKLADRIRRVLPRYQTVTEELSDGQLSGNWEADGGRIVSAIDGIELQSLPSQPEVQLRLLRSQQFNDCYIDATFKDAHDSVWVYGRRSIENLVRFGIDTENNEIHLQIWKDKNRRIHSGHRETLESIPDEINLRLEIRGNGVVGFLNGRPVVSVPLELPSTIGHGWMSVSVQSADRGQARTTITALEAGPLPLQLALLPQTPAEGEIADTELQRIRSLLGSVTDASPNWFSIDEQGDWKSAIDPADDFFRLFSRYYRIRLVPLVQVNQGSDINIEDIERITQLHSLDGVVLRFAQQPSPDWMAKARAYFNDKPIYVYAVMDSSVEGRARIEGFGRSAFLFEDKTTTMDVSIRNITEYQADRNADGPAKKPMMISVK